MEKKKKFVYFSYMISDFFEDGYRQRLVIDFGWIWGPFWEAFSRPKPLKVVIKKALKNMMAKKSRETKKSDFGNPAPFP